MLFLLLIAKKLVAASGRFESFASGCNGSILLKKSRRNFGPRKSVVDVEIWFAQKTELSWFLRSNAKIQRFLIYRKAALSEADFFNKIGQERTLAVDEFCVANNAAITPFT